MVRRSMFTVHAEMLEDLEKEFKNMLVASSGIDKRFKEEQKRVQAIERQMAEDDELDFSEEHLNRNVEEQMKNAPSITKLSDSYGKIMELIQDDG